MRILSGEDNRKVERAHYLETSLSPNNSLLFCRIAGWPIAFFICETETAVRCCETDMNY